jgi:hypothetical protein
MSWRRIAVSASVALVACTSLGGLSGGDGTPDAGADASTSLDGAPRDAGGGPGDAGTSAYAALIHSANPVS